MGSVLLVLGTVLLSGRCFATLLPVGSGIDELLDNAFLPNERSSLDDCHQRYYRFGQYGLVKPAFGQPAYLREFAHMAAIGWTRQNATIGWGCGGSLIWENWILTAAHCAVDDNNIAPDVVRLGDINLYSAADDQHAQQLKIVEIIRHPEHRFSARYHDIALMRLESNVTLHDTVAPACLWVDDEVRFPSLEATGWGRTGHAEAQTPILLKVSLSPMKLEECNKHYTSELRGLKSGLQDHQLCAGDIKMDTCPGDSGGPLQIKLLHNAKISPFLVGITSFGSACGQSEPGVYTKVAPYVSWIRKVLEEHGETAWEWKFRPVECALRYVNLREYEPDVIVGKSINYESIESDRAHMTIQSNPQMVQVKWDGHWLKDDCSGIIIDEDTVLTLAQCTTYFGRAATHVIYQYDKRNDIVKYHNHPRYQEDNQYNNIAILKLRNRFEFSPKFYPACLWHPEKLPNNRFEVSGKGRIDINQFSFHKEGVSVFQPQDTELLPRTDLLPNSNCSYPEEFAPQLPNGLRQEHICFGNKPFLVPNSCKQQFGGPVQRYVYRYDRYFRYVYGLNAFGRDCGFGEAAVATRLSSHVEWLKSVLLPNYRESQGAVHFLNSDLQLGDTCEPSAGSKGICVEAGECPKTRLDFDSNRAVIFCSKVSVVCCPREHVTNPITTEAAKELDQCEERYSRFRVKSNNTNSLRNPTVPSLVLVGFDESDDSISYLCSGTLITKGVALTTASCIGASKSVPKSVMLEPYGKETEVRVKDVIVHPEYSPDTQRNDVALLKMEREIVPTETMHPACIWKNVTHTPILLKLLYSNSTGTEYMHGHPKYNSDCEKSFNVSRTLDASQLCLDMPNTPVCYTAGDPVYWLKPDNEVTIPYLVGQASTETCADELITILTRTASYVNWIKSTL